MYTLYSIMLIASKKEICCDQPAGIGAHLNYVLITARSEIKKRNLKQKWMLCMYLLFPLLFVDSNIK